MSHKNNLKIILIAGLIVIAIVFLLINRTKQIETFSPIINSPTITKEGAFCTADVFQCSDGTYVSRIPPLCSFAPCPDASK